MTQYSALTGQTKTQIYLECTIYNTQFFICFEMQNFTRIVLAKNIRTGFFP